MISPILGFASRVWLRRRLSSLLPFPSSRTTTNDREVTFEFKDLIGRNLRPNIMELNKFLSNTMKALEEHNLHALMNLMEPCGFKPNLVTFNILMNLYEEVNFIKICAEKLSRVDLCYSVLGKNFTLGFEPSVLTTNTLLRSLCVNNRVNETLLIFDKIKYVGYEVDHFTFGTLIDGICRTRVFVAAILFLAKVESHFISLDEVIYNTIFNCLCKEGKPDEALDLYLMMLSKNISLDIITFNTLMCTFTCGNQFEALSLLQQMESHKFVPNLFTYTTLIGALCKEVKLKVPKSVIPIMHRLGIKPDIVAYNSLLNGYCVIREMAGEILIKKYCRRLIIYLHVINMEIL